MIVVNRKRFLKLPAGTPYIEIGERNSLDNALCECPIKIKGDSIHDSDDFYSSVLWLYDRPDGNDEDAEEIASEMSDDVFENGYSRSGHLIFGCSRDGMFDLKDHYAILEPADIERYISELTAGMNALKEFVADPANEKFPRVIRYTEATYPEDEYGRKEVIEKETLMNAVITAVRTGAIQFFKHPSIIGFEGQLYYYESEVALTDNPDALEMATTFTVRPLERFPHRLWVVSSTSPKTLFFNDSHTRDIFDKIDISYVGYTYKFDYKDPKDIIEDLKAIGAYSPSKYHFINKENKKLLWLK